MKSISVASILLVITAAGPLRAADMDGQWARGDGNARVTIADCGANVCATNTWIKPGTPSEKVGDVLVMTIKPVSGKEYSGTAYDPQRHLSYRMNLTMDGASMNTKGCMLGGLICKTVSWTRID
jgi:uncharacterized protein (DUF2147 family)